MLHEREFRLMEAKGMIEDQLIAMGLDEERGDEWAGAAGCEIRDGSFYEPYPHEWDHTLGWCRISWSMKLMDIGVVEYLNTDMDSPYDEAEDIPDYFFARAIGLGWRYVY